MIARYDLDYEHPTFDFFGWGVMARAAGATAISINEKISGRETITRFNSIIAPGAEILGLPIVRCDEGDRLLPSGYERWKLRHLVAFSKTGNQFKRLEAKSIGAEKYTVTLRHSPKSPFRNSNAELWRGFARDIGALVIEDYYDTPISLHDRLSLYAGAQMNFGVWSGPMFLITLTNYPCTVFDWGTAEPFKIYNSGIAPGEAPPWLASGQNVLWQSATARNLKRAWKDNDGRR